MFESGPPELSEFIIMFIYLYFKLLFILKSCRHLLLSLKDPTESVDQSRDLNWIFMLICTECFDIKWLINVYLCCYEDSDLIGGFSPQGFCRESHRGSELLHVVDVHRAHSAVSHRRLRLHPGSKNAFLWQSKDMHMQTTFKSDLMDLVWIAHAHFMHIFLSFFTRHVWLLRSTCAGSDVLRRPLEQTVKGVASGPRGACIAAPPPMPRLSLNTIHKDSLVKLIPWIISDESILTFSSTFKNTKCRSSIFCLVFTYLINTKTTFIV